MSVVSEYTAVVCQADGYGTHWVQVVKADSKEAALEQAKMDCFAVWYGEDASKSDFDSLHVLALFEGDVTVAHYDDSVFGTGS